MVVIRDKPTVIEAALGLDRLCYYWSITLDPESALLFAGQCQEMNAANRLVLTELIQQINAYLPPIDFGPIHPNIGRLHPSYLQSSVKYKTYHDTYDIMTKNQIVKPSTNHDKTPTLRLGLRHFRDTI